MSICCRKPLDGEPPTKPLARQKTAAIALA